MESPDNTRTPKKIIRLREDIRIDGEVEFNRKGNANRI